MGETQPEFNSTHLFRYSVDSTQDGNLFNGALDLNLQAPLPSEAGIGLFMFPFERILQDPYSMSSLDDDLDFSNAGLHLLDGSICQLAGINMSTGWPSQFPGCNAFFTPQEILADMVPTTGQQNDMSQFFPVGPSMIPTLPFSSHPLPLPPQYTGEILRDDFVLLRDDSSPVSSKCRPKLLDSRPVGYLAGHLRHQPIQDFQEENRRDSQATEQKYTFLHWMWGVREKETIRRPSIGDLQWGSDSSFSNIRAYIPEPSKNSVESTLQYHMECLECLEVDKSVTKTCPDSPTNKKPTSGNSGEPIHTNRVCKSGVLHKSRKKGKNARALANDADDNAQSSKSIRKRKPKAKKQTLRPEASSSNTASDTCRKCTAYKSKRPRELQTLEQKRESHVRSEKRRRAMIKKGFDSLDELVPGLRGHGFSKSTALTMAANWLEKLIEGNKALAMQVSTRNGITPE